MQLHNVKRPLGSNAGNRDVKVALDAPPSAEGVVLTSYHAVKRQADIGRDRRSEMSGAISGTISGAISGELVLRSVRDDAQPLIEHDDSWPCIACSKRATAGRPSSVSLRRPMRGSGTKHRTGESNV